MTSVNQPHKFTLKNILTTAYILTTEYIYILPRIATSDPYTHYFPYKVLNNVLYLNEKLFFGISETSQCSICNKNNETIEHLFCHYFVAKALWNGLNTFFENHLCTT